MSYLVLSTISMTKEEMNYASKLTGILFRIMNSPLRKLFFESKERSGKNFLLFVEEIFIQLRSCEELKDTALFKEESIDDMYWNSSIFHEIPSELIIKILAGN